MTAATRLRLFTLLLLTAPLPAAQAYTDTGDLPKVLQGEASGSTWATVVADATAQSTPATPPGSPNPANGGTPVYHSTQLEETTLEGDFTADADTVSLALFSDDGCDVSIGPDKDHLTKIWAARDQAQALPNLAASLHMLPITLTPGQTYHIKIDYSNVIYTGNGDIDGVTLFAFKDTPPSVSMTADDPGDPNINQQVTGKVHASVDHLPSGHFAPDLTATWTWPVVGVTHSDTVDGTFTTDGVDATPFSVTSDNSDLISPTGTFTGTFALGGFYEVEVQANVKYHDNRTGEDLGPYGPGDVFLGDTGDEPPAGSAPAPSMTPAAFVILGPRQAAAGAPQGNNPRPKVKTKQIITTVAIDGLLDPLNPGGLVIPSTDGNGARRQKITVNVTNTPADWFADRNFGRDSVQVLRSSSKIDIYTSATGGQPLVYSGPGATNSFPANQPFPITLWVAGASSSNPSQTMKDVSITAQAYNQKKVGGLPGTALFTVLWVDDIQIKLNPSDGKTFSPENTAAATFNGIYHTSTIGGPQQIGGGSTPITYFSWVYESRGNVHPANFSYPLNKTIDPNQTHNDIGYNHLHIARDIQAYYFFQNSNPQSDITVEWNSISPNANDTDTPKLQSDETSATGNIYAIDGPGLANQWC